MNTAFHWHDEGSIKQIGFNEWVYFYLRSPRMHAMIIYGWAWRHPGIISAQVFPVDAEGRVEANLLLDEYHVPAEEVARSRQSFDARMGGCALSEEAGAFHIQGGLSDRGHTFSWDLRFTRPFPPRHGYEARFGLLPFEYIGWRLLAAPSEVRGAVVLDGEEMEITGAGYVDSNYGRWLVGIDPRTDWNWLMGVDARSGRSVVGMNLRSNPRGGSIHYWDGAEHAHFPTDAGSFRHEAFTEDARTGLMMPTRTHLRAESPSGARLEVLARSRHLHVFEQRFPLSEAGIPLPLSVRWPLIESVVEVEGIYTSPAGARAPIQGWGLKEYGMTTWIPHRVRKALNRALLADGG